MQFSKADKNISEPINYNPPPGYYSVPEAIRPQPAPHLGTNFSKQQRFVQEQTREGPGPGAYYNDKAERVRKRLLEEARRKQQHYRSANTESEIKISSIPSIPKKSTTRVYEQLAPGILILHEEQNQGVNIGPGSYNYNVDIKHKKPIAYKINPEHPKRVQPQPEPELKVPTIAQQIRNEKRQMYRKNIIKTSNINKSMISPADLCLQVIILREKLLRAEENPPPGHYNYQKYVSSFKGADPDLLPEYQLMMGKEQRFKDDNQFANLGPGAYDLGEAREKQGGYISKVDRSLSNSKNVVPGPGSYKLESNQIEPEDPRGNYPPIFGSGSNRFYNLSSQMSQTPGPGSYKIDGKKKKQKYIKIKRNVYESQFVKPSTTQQQNKQIMSINGDKSKTAQASFYKNNKQPLSNHYFKSKVERFSNERANVQVGPGNYEPRNLSVDRRTFNKNTSYTGPKEPRFNQVKVRPNLGPGAYY